MNISNNLIRISNDGIQPVFIYKKKEKSVIEIDICGLPLGAMKNTKYGVYESEVSEGDTMLFLSDGLPELQNAGKKMYGYERIVELFTQIGDKSSDQIVEKLKEESFSYFHFSTPSNCGRKSLK